MKQNKLRKSLRIRDFCKNNRIIILNKQRWIKLQNKNKNNMIKIKNELIFKLIKKKLIYFQIYLQLPIEYFFYRRYLKINLFRNLL